ncbi:Reverse transcriptase zinc-binding domain [Arabidopsis suecica]|uniref:Reverse transcriptase zinc-binding domain n=1 Tax=Arabidopsis suecica TaxID=45249 RepID=A0A8T2CLT9_ARASU|nr:Reverse transcriptase zinc-binding domain [Arabidopsis suecica]
MDRRIPYAAKGKGIARAMANSSWAEAYPTGRSEYLRFEGSDHRPIVTSFDPVKKKSKGLFRYDRRLRENEEVKQLVLKAWNLEESASVEKRIGNCRSAIIKWHKETQLNSQKRIEELRILLEEAMSSDSQNSGQVDKITKDLSLAYQAEEEFWRQRSRQLWLTLGDKNTGYFHAATKGRKAINNISVLEDDKGQVVYEEDQIVKVISDYYQNLFLSQEGERFSTVQEALTPCISDEINEALISLPTPQEIKTACFAINADKAPGPDGFSASFFQSNWPTVGGKLVSEIQNFFNSGYLPQRINHTHVRLIPKITSPKLVSDYRPIALCSVYYKIIAKLLSKRLQPVLQSIISENQSAFVPNRAINDNVLITHETLHYLKTSGAKKRCFMAVKTDMSKAYDRLEWDFIQAVLERFGFHAKWVQWLMQCVKTVSYSFLLNGSAHGLVTPQRGLRQGDPLSPYIFILCSEVLSGLCKRAQVKGTLTGIRVAKGSPRVNHLLFADDTMFFCKSDSKGCAALLSILQRYEAASGQKINTQKSAITFSAKTNNGTKERVKKDLNIQKEGGQGKYLGLPELFGRKKKDLFSQIVDRIKQKALSWSSRFLSQAGKLIMLKSVLAAMPSYTMSCFKIPTNLCKRIQSALTRFWWDANSEKKKMCWVSWKKLTKSTQNGGLGFRDIQKFNDALLAKVSWRILINPHCLLARVLLGKYSHSTHFLDSTTPNSASHGWRGITIGRDLLKSQLGKIIGNGADTSVWSDPWLSLAYPQSPMGPPPAPAKDLKVKDLLKPRTAEWNQNLIKEILPGYEKDILFLKPSQSGATDKWAWLATDSGMYSAKSGYYEALKQDPDLITNDPATAGIKWKADVWSLKTSPMVKMLLWKALQNALPVGENLKHRNVNLAAQCPHCGEDETVPHLFFTCSFAKQIWDKAPCKHSLNLAQISSFRDGFEATKALICLPPTGLGSGAFPPWILWSIWHARNQKIFNQVQIQPEEIMLLATIRAKEWQSAQLKSASPSPSLVRSRLPSLAPPPQVVLCNTDASWKVDGSAGFRWVFSQDGVRLHQGSTAELHLRSPLMAEAMAILHALRHAMALGLRKIHIASDSSQVIKALKSENLSKELHGIQYDILNLSLNFDVLAFNFISRNSNQAADKLAKETLRLFSVST